MKFHKLIFLLSSAIILVFALLIHQINRSSRHKKTSPSIVCTTSIITDVVANITGDTVNITSLMGPGVDPHLYKPVESDMLKIASADIIFYNGLHLEAKMADLFAHLANKQTTVAVTKNIPTEKLLPCDEYQNMHDPHIWFDISLWIYVVDTICITLCNKFPKHADLYKINTNIYQEKLCTLLTSTQTIMNSIPKENRILITAHDAFSYFGNLYECDVIALQGISTESSPGAYDVQKIINFICDKNVPAIFIESSIPIKNILAIQEGVIAHHKNVDVGGQLYSDALGPCDSSGATYIDMILHNVQTIADALSR